MMNECVLTTLLPCCEVVVDTKCFWEHLHICVCTPFVSLRHSNVSF